MLTLINRRETNSAVPMEKIAAVKKTSQPQNDGKSVQSRERKK